MQFAIVTGQMHRREITLPASSPALEGNNIPVAVYEIWYNTVRANTEPLKKYNRFKKKNIGIGKSIIRMTALYL